MAKEDESTYMSLNKETKDLMRKAIAKIAYKTDGKFHPTLSTAFALYLEHNFKKFGFAEIASNIYEEYKIQQRRKKESK